MKPTKPAIGPWRAWAIAAAIIAGLVGLGAVVINRGGSDGSSTDDAVTAAGDTMQADPDGDAGSGVDGSDDTQYPCDLLTEPIAEDIAGIDLDYSAAVHGTGRDCNYVASPTGTPGILVKVTLDLADGGSDCTEKDCRSVHAPPSCVGSTCEVVEEALPSLRDGTVGWYYPGPPGGQPDTAQPPTGLWVEWTVEDQTWWLTLDDGRGPFQEDVPYREGIGPKMFRMDTLARKDALVAAAEEIYGQLS